MGERERETRARAILVLSRPAPLIIYLAVPATPAPPCHEEEEEEEEEMTTTTWLFLSLRAREEFISGRMGTRLAGAVCLYIPIINNRQGERAACHGQLTASTRATWLYDSCFHLASAEIVAALIVCRETSARGSCCRGEGACVQLRNGAGNVLVAHFLLLFVVNTYLWLPTIQYYFYFFVFVNIHLYIYT